MDGNHNMAVECSDIVKQGYLRMKSKNLGVWQKRWVMLRAASSKGPRRLEKYIDEKAASLSTFHKVIELCDVRSVSRLQNDLRRNAAAICFKDESSRQFACDSDLEADEWVKALNIECLGKLCGIVTGEPDLLDTGWQRELSERFHVYLMPTTCLDVYGECLLQVTAENIHIWDLHNVRKKLASWPLNSLRRYGGDSTKFTFEAGRCCDTGEGFITFNTPDGELIYKKVHQSALAIAESYNRAKQRINELRNEQSLKNAETIDNLKYQRNSFSYPNSPAKQPDVTRSPFMIKHPRPNQHQHFSISNGISGLTRKSYLWSNPDTINDNMSTDRSAWKTGFHNGAIYQGFSSKAEVAPDNAKKVQSDIAQAAQTLTDEFQKYLSSQMSS